MRFSINNKSLLISRIINSLYPSKCPSCKNTTDNFLYAPFCTVCWSGIKKYTGPSCKICATPFSSEYADQCAECQKERPSFAKAMSFGIYDGVLAAAINLYKFHGIKRLYRPLGDFLLEFEIKGVDAIIPVPLGIKKLRERGFNQSLLLSKKVADNFKVPLFLNALIKKKETLPQIGLSARERELNLKGAFAVKRNFSGMNLLLIDDVMTTGATANECSKQLLYAGAREVAVLTLARAGDA